MLDLDKKRTLVLRRSLDLFMLDLDKKRTLVLRRSLDMS